MGKAAPKGRRVAKKAKKFAKKKVAAVDDSDLFYHEGTKGFVGDEYAFVYSGDCPRDSNSVSVAPPSHVLDAWRAAPRSSMHESASGLAATKIYLLGPVTCPRAP